MTWIIVQVLRIAAAGVPGYPVAPNAWPTYVQWRTYCDLTRTADELEASCSS